MCEPLVSHTLHFLFRSDFQHRTVKRASVSTRHRGKQESGLLVRAPPPLFLLPSATLEPKKGLRGGGDGAVTWLVHTNFDKAGGLGRGGRQAGRRVAWSGSRQACWSPSAGQHRHLQDRCPQPGQRKPGSGGWELSLCANGEAGFGVLSALSSKSARPYKPKTADHRFLGPKRQRSPLGPKPVSAGPGGANLSDGEERQEDREFQDSLGDIIHLSQRKEAK